MWDTLLVLGLVPGTNFQITFLEMVWTLYIGLMLWAIIKKSQSMRRFVGALYSNMSFGVYLTVDAIEDWGAALFENLSAITRKLKLKERVKYARGIPAGKLHTRHRTA